MYVVRGKLTPEIGALLMRAVEAASDALYRADRASGGEAAACGCGPRGDSQRAARQGRADALGLLAERAMAVGFGGADGTEAPISGTRAERYQVMLHVDADTLDADTLDADTLDAEAEPGRSELEDGTRVSAETSRRVACDAGLVRISHAPDGSVLDTGRRTRTIPPALRRALGVRDRGCRFPGCGLRFTDAHHVRHWADGGRRACPIRSFYVHSTTHWCTRVAGGSTGGERGVRSSSIRVAERTSRGVGARPRSTERRSRTWTATPSRDRTAFQLKRSTATPSRRWSTTPSRPWSTIPSGRSNGITARAEPTPTGERPGPGGSASRMSPKRCSSGPWRRCEAQLGPVHTTSRRAQQAGHRSPAQAHRAPGRCAASSRSCSASASFGQLGEASE